MLQQNKIPDIGTSDKVTCGSSISGTTYLWLYKINLYTTS